MNIHTLPFLFLSLSLLQCLVFWLLYLELVFVQIN